VHVGSLNDVACCSVTVLAIAVTVLVSATVDVSVALKRPCGSVVPTLGVRVFAEPVADSETV
jgi:hypothetical protein